MSRSAILVITILFGLSAHAGPRYRFTPDSSGVGGVCLDEQGNPGLNNEKLAQCGITDNVVVEQSFWSKLSFIRWNRRLNGKDFRGSRITQSDFTKAVMRKTRMDGAYLENVQFGKVDLYEARFSGAELHYCVFAGRLDGADFRGAKATYDKFSGASLRGADFSKASLRRSDLSNADLRGAVLTGVNLDEEVYLVGAQYDRDTVLPDPFNGHLQNAAAFLGMTLVDDSREGAAARDRIARGVPIARDFDAYALFAYHPPEGGRPPKCAIGAGSEGHNPGYLGPCGSLSGLDLRYIDLSNHDLSGADFRGARTEFRGKTLSWVRLVGANLDGVSFDGANLSAVDLSWASLKGASFAGPDTKLFGQLDHADLRGASFVGGDVTFETFQGADLRGADFTGARSNGPDQLAWVGAKFDDSTKLPFSREDALRVKMVYLSSK